MSDELLSSLMAYKYFEANGTFDDFVEYLKVRDKEKEIFKWVKNEVRWDTYNHLLRIIINFFKSEDEDFFKQMSFIVNVSYQSVIDYTKHGYESNTEYPKISKKEFETLFCEFLDYINAPVEWINIYKDLKEKKLIKDDDKSEVYLDENDGIYKISVANRDNLMGFCSFVHEFIHYVSIQNGLPVRKIAVSEFPSIFYEKIAAEFLKEKGYSTEIVDQMINYRKCTNYDTFIVMRDLFDDLFRYIEYGEVNKKDKMTIYQKLIDNGRNENIRSLDEIFKKTSIDENLPPIDIDVEKNTDYNCDFMIASCIIEGATVINGYQYLLDSYLVEQVLNKRSSDSTILEKMINVTNNLRNTSVKDIVTLFGNDTASQGESAKEYNKS